MGELLAQFRVSSDSFLKVPGVLWSIAPNLVYFLVGYALVGTLLTTRVFGKRLMQLTFMEMQREGNLRFDLVRTRENAGGPALCMTCEGGAGALTTLYLCLLPPGGPTVVSPTLHSMFHRPLVQRHPSSRYDLMSA